MNDDDVTRCVAMARPTATSIQCAHSSTFTSGGGELSFYFVTLYDVDINSSWISSDKLGLILIENTYLASFAYNLLLSWVSGNATPSGPKDCLSRSSLLKYNFKKFFGEQLIRCKDCVFSRAIFLETLLFEERAMARLFGEVRGRDDVVPLVQRALSTFLSITRLHELNHHFANMDGTQWTDLLGRYLFIDEIIAGHGERLGSGWTEEVKCDALSILITFRECETNVARAECLKATIFGFATFAVMVSLERSAEATIRDYYSAADDVDLSSLDRIGGIFNFAREVDEPFICRARVVQSICDGIAQAEDLTLYDDSSRLTFGSTIIDEFLLHIGTMMDQEDQDARNMSHLVSAALHGHTAGVAFLVNHSRTLRSAAAS